MNPNPPWLVVGLGNPGPDYELTRHNVGFMVADELAARAQSRFSTACGMRALVAETRLGPAGLAGPGATRVLVVKPTTYMNDSGIAVAKIAAFHHVAAQRIVVIHDELDLDLGRMRLKCGGGDNGHNGLKSIRAHLHTGDFYRVRVGIGRPPGRQPTIDYVLGRFPASQRADLGVNVALAADAVAELLVSGLAEAQNKFNN